MLQSDANRMKSFACPGGVEVIVGYFRQIKNHLVLFGDFMPQQDEQIIDFGPCPVCNAENWTLWHHGSIRNGSFDIQTEEKARVAKCGDCGVIRLEETFCKAEEFYRSGQYRNIIGEQLGPEDFFRRHDPNQLSHLTTLKDFSFRDSVLADIGCGAGSFLDHVNGLVDRAIAIEPGAHYHQSLKSRGYDTFSNVSDSLQVYEGAVDFAICFSVIAHVPSPLEFLSDVRRLIKPGGILALGFDNANYLLLAILPEIYPSFYYRTFHRWYFDAPAFLNCANRAGFGEIEFRYVQHYDLSNAMQWLRNKQPSGIEKLPHLDDSILNSNWRSCLQSNQVSNYVIAVLHNPAN